MKQYSVMCYIFSILFLLPTIPMAPNDNSSKTPPIIFNNYMTGSTATATAQNQTTTSQESKTSVQLLTPWYDSAQKTAMNCYDQMLQHKYKILMAGACAYYVHLNYQLHAVSTMICDETSWCNWKATASMQQLIYAPHDELIPQLLADIQKKYLLSKKISLSHNHESAIDQFIKEVSHELALLQNYVTIQKWTKTLHVSKLFYFSYKKSMIQEKINRLHIMLDIFISWQTKELLK